MLQILQRKYPFKPGNWKDSLLLSAIVFLILYFLVPFGLNIYEQNGGNLLGVVLGYSLITYISQAAYQKCVSRLAARKSIWTIADAGLSCILFWLFLGLCNAIYSIVVFHIGAQYFAKVILVFLYWTFIIGVILGIVTFLVNYNRYLKTELAGMLQKNTEEQEDIIVTIHDTAARGSDLRIGLNEFLYAESQKNDVTIYYKQGRELLHRTMRLTMAALLSDLDYHNIFQCHRSFVVNINNISDAKGNSNGYQLKLSDCPAAVPVSRTYVPKLKSYL